MVVTQLEMIRFKRFLNRKIVLVPGLNIIRGPNESGKSTMKLALTAALFGNPTSSSEAVRNLTTWGQTERCELRLEFHDEQGVVFQLRKDFAGGKIFMLRDQESLQSYKGIQNQIAEILGIPTEELFNLCTSLDVRSLANLGTQAERKNVGKMLAGLMTGTTGSGQDVLQAIKKLDEALRDLGRGERQAAVKNPGPLKAAKDLLLQLKGRLLDAREKLRLKEERMVALEKLRLEHKQTKERLEGLRHLLDANQQLVQATKRKDELIALDRDFDQRAQILSKLEHEYQTLEQALAENPLARFSPEKIENLRSYYNVMRQKENRASVPPAQNALIPWLVGGGVGLGIFGLIMIYLHGITGFLFFAGAMGILLAAGIAYRTEKEKIKQFQVRQEQEQAEWTAIEQKISVEMKDAPGMKVEEVFQVWPAVQQQLADRKAVEKQLASAKTAVAEEHWQSVRRDLRLQEDKLQDAGMAALALPADALAIRQREAQRLETEVRELSSQISKCEGILEHSQIHQDAVTELEEQIAEGQMRLEYLEGQEKLLQLTRDLLDQARRQTLHPAQKILEKRAGELMATMSRGKYTNIAVDDEDLSSKILIMETGRWESPSVLSQGAFDQFFLSVRLALAEVLTQGRKTPLLLDEPLAAFDPMRAQAAMECLRLLSRERQILFFTCRPDYDQAADQVVFLE
ncbi:AAA family ATPase [candidate division FCPU426 bacterium]|nr:AAA family ATPase [candidate division FCPU426 bacterium]